MGCCCWVSGTFNVESCSCVFDKCVLEFQIDGGGREVDVVLELDDCELGIELVVLRLPPKVLLLFGTLWVQLLLLFESNHDCF